MPSWSSAGAGLPDPASWFPRLTVSWFCRAIKRWRITPSAQSALRAMMRKTQRHRHPRDECNCVRPGMTYALAAQITRCCVEPLSHFRAISDFQKLYLTFDPNQLRIPRRPVPREGALAIVTDVGAGSGGRESCD
jgi:hypothetical protein